MICKNCNNETPNRVAFCPHCGCKQVTKQETAVLDKRKPQLLIIAKGKIIWAIGIVILILIIAIVSTRNSSVNSSPEKVAAAFVEAVHSRDIPKQVKCLSDYTVRYYASELYAMDPNATRSQLKEQMLVRYNAMIDHWVVGGLNPDDHIYDVLISDVQVVENLNKNEINHEKYRLTVEEYNSIEDVVLVCVAFRTIPKSNNATTEEIIKSEDISEMYHVCIKVHGKWYYLE